MSGKRELTPEESAWKQQLESNPEVANWLKKFNSASQKSFLEEYIRHKSHWLKIGEMTKKNYEASFTRFQEKAARLLWLIQQKKLFDLQILWRAEQAQVPGVRHTHDFLTLQHKIQTLTFLDPITETEVGWLREFIRENPDADDWAGFWQDYNPIRYNHPEELPAWYHFVNLRTGKNSLFQLPNIRGDKEERYLDAVRNENKKATEAKQKSPQVIDQKPFLTVYHYEDMEDFVKNFETREMADLYKVYRWQTEKSDHDVSALIFDLQEQKELIPVEAHADWREALVIAWNKFESKKILEALDSAFEDYQFRMNTGIGFAEVVEEVSRPLLSTRSHLDYEWYSDYILKGRKLLGEPEDFNF